MARKDILVIGASAGGMEALQKVASSFPADLPASVFVVWHLSPVMKTIGSRARTPRACRRSIRTRRRRRASR